MEDKRLISELYDAIASSYEKLYGEEQLAKLSEIMKYLPERSFQAVLDAGCGTGLFFEKLSEIGREIVGLDLSWEMLRRARGRACRFNVHLVRGDLEHLPFHSECFDLVVSVTVLPVSSSNEQALLELGRVLSSNGLAALTVPKEAKIVEEVLRTLRQLNIGIRGFYEKSYIKDAVIIAER